jgi:hypothetical protein
MKDIIFFRTVKEFKLDWLVPAAYSLIFFILAYLVFLGASNMIQDVELAESYANLASISQSAAESLDQGVIDALLEFNTKFRTVIAVALSFFAYLIISYTVLWFFIYRSTYRKKLKKISMLKFLAFNIVAVTAALTVIICAVVGLKTSAALIIVPLLMLIIWYKFSFFNMLFFKEEKVFLSIKRLYLLTITKFHRFIPAFGWSFLAFLVLATIAYFLAMVPVAGTWLLLLPLIIWLTFTRYYFINILAKNNKKQSLKMIDIKVLKKRGNSE